MELEELFMGREGERITPIHLSEVVTAFGNSPWWIKIKGKVYSPHELTKNYHRFQNCKVGDLEKVDPLEELARADKILADMKQRRDEFAERIEHFSRGFWH